MKFQNFKLNLEDQPGSERTREVYAVDAVVVTFLMNNQQSLQKNLQNPSSTEYIDWVPYTHTQCVSEHICYVHNVNNESR